MARALKRSDVLRFLMDNPSPGQTAYNVNKYVNELPHTKLTQYMDVLNDFKIYLLSLEQKQSVQEADDVKEETEVKATVQSSKRSK